MNKSGEYIIAAKDLCRDKHQDANSFFLHQIANLGLVNWFFSKKRLVNWTWFFCFFFVWIGHELQLKLKFNPIINSCFLVLLPFFLFLISYLVRSYMVWVIRVLSISIRRCKKMSIIYTFSKLTLSILPFYFTIYPTFQFLFLHNLLK